MWWTFEDAKQISKKNGEQIRKTKREQGRGTEVESGRGRRSKRNQKDKENAFGNIHSNDNDGCGCFYGVDFIWTTHYTQKAYT